MKAFFTIIFSLVCLSELWTQQINPSGGSVQNEEFSAEWIIGGSLIDNSVLLFESSEITYLNNLYDISLIAVNPSPAKEFITISRNSGLDKMLNYKILNSLGVEMLAGNMNLNNPFTIYLTSLSAGQYLIIFSSPDDKNFLISKKFIKL